MTNFNYKYAHAAILVTNIERSRDFYQRAVGWEHEFSLELETKAARRRKAALSAPQKGRNTSLND